MRRLVVGTFLTLDGVMQGPGGPNEDREGGFAHGGWSVKYWDDMMGKVILEQMAKPDALLLGRKTYEIFASHWPRVTDPNDPVASKLNSMRKYVASRTLKKVEWHNSTLLRGDAAIAVARLKEQAGGEILSRELQPDPDVVEARPDRRVSLVGLSGLGWLRETAVRRRDHPGGFPACGCHDV